jgi:hypothetical protein
MNSAHLEAAAAPSRPHRTGARRALALTLILAVFGCASPSAPRYHTLQAADRPAPREGLAPAGGGPQILLEPVRVPAQVDQPQWLVRMPDESLALLEQERWASPLRDEFRLALREILVRRFGAIEIRAAAGDTPVWRIRVDVTRFESLPGEARIDATYTVTPSAPPTGGLRCAVFLREPAGAGMPALAEAHRRAVARLGEAIGQALLALQRDPKAGCPAS